MYNTKTRKRFEFLTDQHVQFLSGRKFGNEIRKLCDYVPVVTLSAINRSGKKYPKISGLFVREINNHNLRFVTIREWRGFITGERKYF